MNLNEKLQGMGQIYIKFINISIFLNNNKTIKINIKEDYFWQKN